MSIRDKELEKEIVDKGLIAPRVTLGLIQSKIEDIEIVTHQTRSGKIFRWAVLTMENGFAITGKPSASVSPENDDKEIGEKIAIDNAMNETWGYEGYLLAENLFLTK